MTKKTKNPKLKHGDFVKIGNVKHANYVYCFKTMIGSLRFLNIRTGKKMYLFEVNSKKIKISKPPKNTFYFRQRRGHGIDIIFERSFVIKKNGKILSLQNNEIVTTKNAKMIFEMYFEAKKTGLSKYGDDRILNMDIETHAFRFRSFLVCTKKYDNKFGVSVGCCKITHANVIKMYSLWKYGRALK